ncbi:MAG: type IV pilus assembly protein PilM [bacterium]
MAFSFRNLFQKITGKKSYLGVDIGTTSIKIVELANAGEKPVLKNYGILESYGHLERLNNAIQTSSLKMLDRETAELLAMLVKQLKGKTTDVIASLPTFSAFTALLDIPVMSPEETAQAMQYQARAFVPLPVSEVTIDWIPIEEYEDEKGRKKQHILLVSVPNEHIERYQRIFKLAGLQLRALEIEGLSLSRILTAGDPTLTLIVDIGARSTAILVSRNGFLKYTAQTDFAGGSLTQAVSSGLRINIHRAEELKKRKGLLGTGGEQELSALMVTFLDVILGEVQRVRINYEKDYKEKIERVILSGGGANLLGIERYMSDVLKIPVVKANPFDRVIYPPAVSPFLKEMAGPFSTSLGLGIKEFL